MVLESEQKHLLALKSLFKNKIKDPEFLRQLEEKTFKFAIEELIEQDNDDKFILKEHSEGNASIIYQDKNNS